MSREAKVQEHATLSRPLQYADRLDLSLEWANAYLFSVQHADGYWLGELEADTTLESDYIFYLHVLGQLDSPRVPKLATVIRRNQLADGGWNIYAGGPSELNATVKAYFALKLAGDSPDSPHLNLARKRVHELGGLEHTNSFTRFYLALAGATGWDMVPAVPPELMLLPNWFPINIYEMSSWTRAIVVPLTLLYACKPCWPAPARAKIDELFRNPLKKRAALDFGPGFSWRNFFLALDRALKLYERLPWKPGRARAVRLGQEWMLEHLDRTEGLAAIYPAMMNSIYALMALGYPPSHPLTAHEIHELSRFEIEESNTVRLQPCLSPVWDTAIALFSLIEGGSASDDPLVIKAARWLLDKQILNGGDWQIKNRDAEPGGWAFEFRNDFYPDIDDTAFVLMALQRVSYPDKLALDHAMGLGIRWMISMQNADGGWGAFDRDNNRTFLNHIPFADHNAMLDPSSPDVTARVVECLGQFGWTTHDHRIRHGIDYLLREQTPGGAWYGRWGVNYVYGTSGVLRALTSVDANATPAVERGVAWLRSVQNADGGFGESCGSYDDARLMGKGPSTPSQTAWGLLGLLTNAGPGDAAVDAAAEYLVTHQNDDGSWTDPTFTGTGFPRVFYLKYHLYSTYFPLFALGRYRRMARRQEFPRRIQ
jgi:squalene-hopene/tetraprenyl-beta-curcumene cyclase